MRFRPFVSPVEVSWWLYALRGVVVCRSRRRFSLRFVLPVLLLMGAPDPARGSGAPSDLTATLGEAGVSLSWSAPTANASKVTGYQVMRRSSVDPVGGFHAIATTGASETSYVDAFILEGETFVYRVKARRGNRLSGYSNFVLVDVPSAPAGAANLTAVAGNRSVSLSWDDPSDATITVYELRFAEGGGTDPPDWTGVMWREIENSDASTTFLWVSNLTNGTEYTFELRARNVRGAGATASVTATPIPPPAVPIIQSVSVGDGTVTLSWVDQNDVTITVYEFRFIEGVASDPLDWTGVEWSEIAGSDFTLTSHTATGLTNGTLYTFQLRARNTAGAGVAATVAAIPVPPPLAPVNLSASVGDGTVTLSWDDPNDATIEGYQYRYRTGAEWDPDWTDVDGSDAGTASHRLTGLTNGTAHIFEVRATNAAGGGAASSVTATPAPPPLAPVHLSTTAGHRRVTLRWDDPDDATITGYQYRYRTGAEWDPDWTDVDASDATTTSHRLTGLVNGTRYTIQLRAKNPAGDGAASTVASTPFALPPRNLSVALVDGSVTLSWDAPEADAELVTGYEVLRRWPRNDGPGVFHEIGTTGADVTTYMDGTVEGGERYVYRVKAWRGTDMSPWSDWAAIDAPAVPSAPENLSALVGDGSVTLSWDDANDNSITGYQYRYRTGMTWNPDWTAIGGSGANTTSHRLTGLTNETEYTFEVRAINANGNGTLAGVTATPAPPPAAPGNLAGSAGDGTVTLSWDNPNDATITGYEYRYRTGAEWDPDWTEIGGSDFSTTSYTAEGLTSGALHTFQVRAVNAAGPGPSASASATPFPAAPANLLATAGVNQVTLEWDDPADDGITVYQLKYGHGTTLVQDWSDISDTDQNTTEHTVEGLANGTAYTFKLRAKATDAPGDSSEVTATPYPAAPANLQAAAGVNQVALTWNNPGDAGITVYQLKYGHGTTVVQDWSDVSGTNKNTTEHTVEGLTNGTAYTFKLRAKATDALGDSSEVTATPYPAAPANLQAAAGVNQVALTWNNPGDDGITAYQLKYGHGTTVVQDWSDVSDTDKNTTEHTVEGLTNGTAYTFKLRAKATDALGDSSEVTATPFPAAPANLRGTGGDGKVTLNWDDPGDAAITVYQLVHYSGTRPSQPTWGDISGSDATTTSHAVMNLTNDRKYTFELRAKATSAHGDSSVVKATPTVSCPTLTIASISDVTKAAGSSISITASASGGCGTKTFSKKSGPSWISVSSGGSITGTVSSSARCNSPKVVVKVTDANGNTDDEEFRITVPGATLTIASISDVTAAVDDEISITASASGGCGTKTFSKKSGPSWISVASGGSITGTVPSSARCSSPKIVVKVTDGNGNTDDEEFKILVRAASTLTIASISDVTAAVDDEISITASASGGCGTKTFSKKSGPSWISVSSGGSITGTVPSSAACSSPKVVVEVTDGNGNTDEEDFQIKVGAASTLTIASISDVTAAVDDEISITASASGGCGTKTFSKESGPSWISVSSGGSITGTVPSTAVCSSPKVVVKVTDGNGITDKEDFQIKVGAASTLTIASISDVTAAVDDGISITASASGGCGTKTFSKESGPSWISVSSGGSITGTVPNSAVCSSPKVVVKVTDGNGITDKEDFQIKVGAASTLTIASISDVTAAVDDEISITASASGGCGTKTFSKESGPSWISVSSGGSITGTVPSSAACSSPKVVVKVTDGNGITDNEDFKIIVGEASTLEVAAIADVTKAVDDEISITASASGGCGTKTFSKESGPSWISVSSGGSITGTVPSSAACSSPKVVVKVTDGNESTDEEDFTITVGEASTLAISSISNKSGTKGRAISSFPVGKSGGCSPYTYSLSSNPSSGSGLSISSSGRISGTPTATSSFTISVTVTDVNNTSKSTSFTFSVAEPVTIASISDITEIVSVPFTHQVSVSGGRSPYRYSLSVTPTLPSGSSLSISASGLIEGEITERGTHSATVTVSDADNRTDSEAFDITARGPGDFNGDGTRNAADAAMLNEKSGLSSSDAGFDRRMDLNGDGTINFADLVILSGYIQNDASSQGGGDSGGDGG